MIPEQRAADPGEHPPQDLGRVADLLVAGFVIASLVAYGGSSIFSGVVSIRTLLLWVAAGCGVTLLGREAIRGDVVARWAAAFVAWSFVSMLASGNVAQSLWGGLGTDQGWAMLSGYVCCWAIGRVRRSATDLVTGAIVVGAGLNALLGIAQVIHGAGIGIFRFEFGRAQGLMGNPVLYAGVMCGALVLCGALAGRAGSEWWAWLGGVALFGAAVNLSGSRVALVGGLVLVALAAWAGGIERAVLAAGVTVVSYAATWSLFPEGAGERLTGSGGGGLRPRLEMWGSALHAVVHHPILGYGPGRFATATSPWTTQRFVQAEGLRSHYADGHNLVIELLTTTGVVGLLLAAAFVWTAVRRARGPMAWFCAGVVVTWLLEPSSVYTAPVALLALGLADTGERAARRGGPEPEPADDGRPPPFRRSDLAVAGISVVLALVGAYCGGRLVLADKLHTSGVANFDLADLDHARDLLPHDLAIATDQADLRSLLSARRPVDVPGPSVIAAGRDVVDLDRERAESWSSLAIYQASYGDGTKAQTQARIEHSLRQGYARNPWSTSVMTAWYSFEKSRHHEQAAESWRRKLCSVGLCPRRGT